ncbi:MAG: hypothetical protein Q4C04_04200 [Clostridia bacterium]|nr:hypothetical protein [Clostridia bacterium]
MNLARLIRSLMLALLTTVLVGCGAKTPVSVAPSNTPAATAAPTVSYTATPTLTPEPTPSPTLDPLVGSWSDNEGVFVLVLNPDGTYSISSEGQTATGSYSRAGEALVFTGADGNAYTCNFSLDGGALTIQQDGYAVLHLIRISATEG